MHCRDNIKSTHVQEDREVQLQRRGAERRGMGAVRVLDLDLERAAHHVGGCSRGASLVLLPRKMQCGAAGAELSTAQSRLTGRHLVGAHRRSSSASRSISWLRSERPALPLRALRTQRTAS